jgi:hypothetical protein
MNTHSAFLILLAGCQGADTDRGKAALDAPQAALKAESLMADSASVCWERFSRSVPVETNCTSLGVTARVDTVRVAVRDTVVIPPSSAFVPFAFGPYDMYRGPGSAEGFTAGHSYADPQGLVSLLKKLRTNKQRAFLALTGGSHDQYITFGRFDMVKWKAGLARYDTPVLKAALQEGVADGTILGYNMIDEPPHPSWGGVLTKATVDAMATYCKSLFPFLPCGAAVDHRWRPAERYRVLDFMMAQTWMERIGPEEFRDSAVAVAKQNGVALVLSINLFGERQTPGCERRGNQCWMRPADVREWGRIFLSEPSACAVTLWRYEAGMWSRPEYQAQFSDLSNVAKQRVAKPCRR